MAIVKKLKQHPPLPPSRYEVGIYCRVSTASKTQVVSIGHQLSGLIADVANSQQARLYDVYLDIQSGRTWLAAALLWWASPSFLCCLVCSATKHGPETLGHIR